jgi:hypothetical protein
VVARRASIMAAASALLAAAAPVIAEVQTTAEVSVLAGIVRAADEASFVNSEEGRVVFQAASSRDIKALLEADVLLRPGGSPDFSLGIPRAYLKVRFPWFRLTAGKTRLSWGSGFLFDAGDVIFGEVPLYADLSAADPRDRTAWLVSPYIAVGDFSLIEGVFLPSMPAPPSPVPVIAPPLVSMDSVSGGVRAVLGFPGIKLEAGYLYDGERDAHKPYVSAQGSLFFEIYGAAGTSIPGDASSWDDVEDGLRFSCGLFRIFDLEDWGNLLVRSEAGFTPAGEWEEAAGGLLPAGPGYGVDAFFELSYSPYDTVSLAVRNMLSPVDLSGIVLLSATWGIYQGLTLSFTASMMFGDVDDVYGWDRDGDIGAAAGLKFAF